MYKKLIKLSLAIFTLYLVLFNLGCKPKPALGQKTKGLVPDEQTAIRIAEAIWLPIYGDKIYEQKPFTAFLVSDGFWVVYGTAQKGDDGFLFIFLDPKDGRVVKVGREIDKK